MQTRATGAGEVAWPGMLTDYGVLCRGLAAVERDQTWRAGEAENLGTRMEAVCVIVDDGRAKKSDWRWLHGFTCRGIREGAKG